MKTEINHTGIWYDLLGSQGPKVALLHGWGCSHQLMMPLAEAMKDHYRLLLIDFPGHGLSDEPAEPWGVPEYAEALAELMTRLDFVPASLVGHSFGCRVAAYLAANRPDMVHKLVLTGAAGLKKPSTPEAEARSARFRKLKERARKMEAIPGFRGLGERMEEKLRQKYGSPDYNALDEQMRKTFVRVVNEDLAPLYPRIQASTLLIWGDADTETPLWMGQKMEEMIPDAGLAVLEGGTHFAYLEQGQRFQTIVTHFLTEDTEA